MRREAVQFVRRGWRLILGVTLACLLFGLLFAILSPTKYKSSAQLLVDPRGLQILKSEITRTGDSTDGNLVDIENQRYILLSRSILGAVVDHEHLVDNPLFGGKSPGLLSRTLAAFGAKAPQIDKRARAVQALADMVEVVRGERAYVLDVVVTTPDANLSATLANVIARTFLDAQNDARSDVAKRASDELARRAEDLRHQVQKAEAEVERYRAEHNLIQTPTGRLLDEQQIADLSQQLGLVRARIADAQARVQAVEKFRKSGQNVDSLSEALASPTMTSLRSQYAQAAQQAGSLATQLGPRHPALVQAQEQVRDARRLINAELERIADAARTDLARAKDSETSLQKQSGQVRVVNEQSNVALVKLRDLERAAEASRTVYQAFLARAKELGESQGIDSTYARVISPAIPAMKKAGAPAILVLAGSLLFGLVLGSGLAYARDRLDGVVRSRHELLELTGLPTLAAFRLVETKRTGVRREPQFELAPDRAAFRHLLARIDLAPGGEQKSVAFVSPHGGALATQLVVGLAEFARWEDLDVGVVDAHGDRSSASGVFDDAPRRGRGRGDIEAVSLADLSRSGSLRQLRRAFADLESDSDIVLIDAPSPAHDADVASALDLADSIALVLEPHDLDRSVIETTLEALAEYEERLVGVVLIGDLAEA